MKKVKNSHFIYSFFISKHFKGCKKGNKNICQQYASQPFASILKDINL